jgi:hypothetical protein
MWSGVVILAWAAIWTAVTGLVMFALAVGKARVGSPRCAPSLRERPEGSDEQLIHTRRLVARRHTGNTFDAPLTVTAQPPRWRRALPSARRATPWGQ